MVKSWLICSLFGFVLVASTLLLPVTYWSDTVATILATLAILPFRQDASVAVLAAIVITVTIVSRIAVFYWIAQGRSVSIFDYVGIDSVQKLKNLIGFMWPTLALLVLFFLARRLPQRK